MWNTNYFEIHYSLDFMVMLLQVDNLDNSRNGKSGHIEMYSTCTENIPLKHSSYMGIVY